VVEPRRLTRHYRVRFDEADAEGRLRPSGLLRYAQDIAWRHSEAAGFDRDRYDERAMAWVVRNILLSIRQQATHGSELAITTEVVGLRHVRVRRRTTIHGSSLDTHGLDGQPIAKLDTDWVLLTSEGRPAPVPEEIVRHFSTTDTFSRSRVVLPDPTRQATTVSTCVRPSEVDPMGHMNNAAYLDLVDDALARMPELVDRDRPEGYRIGYVRPACQEAPSTWPAGRRMTARWPAGSAMAKGTS
jgi:acyl-CoA thioesterase FadM